MSNTHGGARSGAGRPYTPIGESQTPLMRHWQALEQEIGKERADRMHVQFNEWNQEYQKAQITKQRARRQQERS